MNPLVIGWNEYRRRVCCWTVVAGEPLNCVGDVARHGQCDGTLGFVEFEVYAAVFGSRPVYGDGIELLEYQKEIVSSRLLHTPVAHLDSYT